MNSIMLAGMAKLHDEHCQSKQLAAQPLRQKPIPSRILPQATGKPEVLMKNVASSTGSAVVETLCRRL
jgi:hypothetical protein